MQPSDFMPILPLVAAAVAAWVFWRDEKKDREAYEKSQTTPNAELARWSDEDLRRAHRRVVNQLRISRIQGTDKARHQYHFNRLQDVLNDRQQVQQQAVIEEEQARHG